MYDESHGVHVFDWFKENFDKSPSQTFVDDIKTYEIFKKTALKDI